jgi:hypothetical protein
LTSRSIEKKPIDGDGLFWYQLVPIDYLHRVQLNLKLVWWSDRHTRKALK